jgi:hypothetical protein
VINWLGEKTEVDLQAEELAEIPQYLANDGAPVRQYR